jgi:S-adenosylmethionine:tRNA ribosyltransferase-isomerase
MRTADFSFELPEGLVAQHPAEPRDSARLMVVDRSSGSLEHRVFREFSGLCRSGDLIVVNNTRVIPARLWARRRPGGGRVQVLLVEETEPGVWSVLLKARRRLETGSVLDLAEGSVTGELLSGPEGGRWRVRFDGGETVLDLAARLGRTPLPPYIKRTPDDAGADDGDRASYQTVFARESGAVAAPTAGLHFTPAVLEELRRKGVGIGEITLHVGPGTFRPITADAVEEHVMEPERFVLPAETAALHRGTRAGGGRVIAVGSTSVRVLEHVAARRGAVCEDAGRTDLYVYPPYTFRAVDAMLTNFHLPRSTLLLLVCAFAGRDLMLRAYKEAVRERYRFYSYGDCMLIV